MAPRRRRDSEQAATAGAAASLTKRSPEAKRLAGLPGFARTRSSAGGESGSQCDIDFVHGRADLFLRPYLCD